MWCPKCGAEYREGFYRCADCDVDLVYEPPKKEKDTSEEEYSPYDTRPELAKFVKLLEVNSGSEIAFLKSILEPTDIPYYFKSRALRISRPGQPPADLMVEETRLEEVRELLKDFMSK